MRRRAQELVALFGGKMPHDMSIVPGGVTYRPTLGDVAAFRFRLQELKSFIAEVYVPDVLLLAERYHDYFGVGKVDKLLSFGGFPEESGDLEKRLFPPGVYRHGKAEPLDPSAIREAVARSWYEGAEAPRGAVGHWGRIGAGRIAHYQVVAPTTWNASPRDEAGNPGPIEKALEGTRVSGDGLCEAGRIVRSFDPCLACAVQ